jgi:SPRY domain
MKRLLRSGTGRSGSMDHQGSNNVDPATDASPFPSAIGISSRTGRSQSAGERAFNSLPENHMQLPSAWTILDEDLRCSDPFSVRLYSPTPSLKTTIYANVPIPFSSHLLHDQTASRSMGRTASGRNIWGRQRRSGDSSNNSSIYPTLEGPTHQPQTHPGPSSTTRVYYFEVTIDASSSGRCLSSSEGSPAIVDVMIGFVQGECQAAGIWPGEIPSSIGWGSDGLYVNGQRSAKSGGECGVQQFYNGDIIGCGMEIGGMQRAFFTRNGTILVPPTTNTAFIDGSGPSGGSSTCYPVIAFQHVSGQGVLKSNFGLDARFPFRWLGDGNLDFISHQPGGRGTINNGQSVSMGDLPVLPRAELDSPRSPSPFYGLSVASVSTNHVAYDTMTRSASRRTSSEAVMSSISHHSTPYSSSHTPNSSTARVTPSTNIVFKNQDVPSHDDALYGTQNSRRSLEDDDPVAAANSEHFNMVGGTLSVPPPQWLYGVDGVGGNAPASDAPASAPAQSSSPTRIHQITCSSSVPGTSETSLRRLDSTRRRREERAQQRRENSASTLSNDGREATSGVDILALPPSVEYHTPVISTTSDRVDGIVAHVAGGELLKEAKVNSQSLLGASKSEDVDFVEIRELLDQCQKDQQQLQVNLSTALEEADAIDNLEELFAVNDEICTAIEAGKTVLKREKGKGETKSFDGPTIEVLVENQDIFSLICMLRVTNEKRLQAALALMTFAKSDPVLSNEIRSSGGMHSFLALFRTRGTTRELQVVASMAVAYILPSFVSSSQTSPSVGLKIMECLRFLVIANPVSPNDIFISNEQMCHAASVGVNVLWINAIQPLMSMEKVKTESRNTRAVLNASQSLRLGRSDTGVGGSVFDQGLESMEIQELAESAVMLIAHLVKLSHWKQVRIDMEYEIVEQVCEVDQARPIAVREGLLAIFVEWIRSGDINKIKPAASALRHLISTRDKYMAGWIHSQVVNEGAIKEIVKLLNESVGHSVRVAVSEMLSALCIAPHTRAAVVEANCVSYLVALLYEHTAPDSEEMVYCAGNALLQLAACSMMRSNGSNGFSLPEHPESSSKAHDVVT